MSTPLKEEPIAEITLPQGKKITLIGTAHVSRSSAEKVKELLETGTYDAVAVELCPSRYNALINPNQLAKMNLFEVIRQKKASMVIASLALGAYQQRLAEQFGIEPGAEMKAAIGHAKDTNIPILLIDREVGTTLKRIYRNIKWWQRMNLITGLFASVLSKEKVSEEEIERLKEGDMLETTFSEFAAQAKDLYIPLIEERDHYMALNLISDINIDKYNHVLAVIGAGHLHGIQTFLNNQAESKQADIGQRLSELEHIPNSKKWPKTIPWIIVALIVMGFIIGFSRNTELGWQLVMDWVLINGSLAALGALIAAAHPLTVVGAFIAAPLTSLNPTIGAGVVTAAIEVYLRKPSVGDFSRLRSDTTHIKGWWKNRVSRTLLVFLFSTLGSAIGTYVAGFRIFERLSG